ncbi:MAG: nucleoside-diphosphate sugar epimerase/dehydratase [Patescibacteria group bacterium]
MEHDIRGESLYKRVREHRQGVFAAADTAAIAVAVVLAFLLRFDGRIPAPYLGGTLLCGLGLILGSTLLSFAIFRLYSFSWSHVGLEDIFSIGRALLGSALFAGLVLLMFRDTPALAEFPRSVFLLSYVLIFVFTGGIRLAKRLWMESLGGRIQGGERTLIVGAGDAGAQLVRNALLASPRLYAPVGFVDDDQGKHGTFIHGVEVLGSIERIPELVSELRLEAMVIALPTAGSKFIRRAVEAGRQAGLSAIKIVPPLEELLHGEISLQQLREVQVEDLLGREAHSLDTESIAGFLQGKRVLVTGAAGSIGSELAKQAVKFFPETVFLLDQDESGIFTVARELERSRVSVVPVVADIRSGERMTKLFGELRPDVVFHAAAYKHVPLMEQYPEEAVRTNILGTGAVAAAALHAGVGTFVFVSTDKAVNPVSVMGASKRAGEMICQAFNQKNHTRFVSVRFGNVLDSRGSVIPLFRSQLKRGGPLEVTHPEMKRYFMVTSEACLLVMQAGAIGEGGEVFVLDMGEPVKILDLAYDMIRLSGLEPDRDIPVVFTGMRPGEKLFEEILSAEEGTAATRHHKIFHAQLPLVDEGKLSTALEQLKEVVQQGSKEDIRRILRELVPTYVPQET